MTFQAPVAYITPSTIRGVASRPRFVFVSWTQAMPS